MEELEHVPTVEELHAAGHARVLSRTKTGQATEYQPDAEGQRMIYDAMARNAERQKAIDIAGKCGRTMPGGFFCTLEPHGSDRHRRFDEHGRAVYWSAA